jgi:hypothetical protein
MSTAVSVKTTPLRTHGAVRRALKWGWTVRCRILKVQLPVGGIELTVDDVREVDVMDASWDGEFQVLTIQGWHTPTTVWAIRPAKKAVTI